MVFAFRGNQVNRTGRDGLLEFFADVAFIASSYGVGQTIQQYWGYLDIVLIGFTKYYPP